MQTSKEKLGEKPSFQNLKHKKENGDMMNMLIQLDEERVLADRKYDLADMWRIIDKQFASAFTKTRHTNGAVLYEGRKDRDYYTGINVALFFLEKQDWFAEYCMRWIWYSNEDDENLPFSEIDVLERQKEDNLLFRHV